MKHEGKYRAQCYCHGCMPGGAKNRERVKSIKHGARQSAKRQIIKEEVQRREEGNIGSGQINP